MVELKTEHGTFTAETEQEVLSAARKAKREAARQEKITREACDRAALLAKAAGYDILRSIVDNNLRMMEFRKPNQSCGVKVRPHDLGRGQVALCETRGGTIETSHYGLEVLGSVCDCAGFTVALFLRDRDLGDSSDAIACYAIASADGQYSLQPLPSVKHGMFPYQD